MKLMLVGRSARGKTTLLNKITEKGWTSAMPRWGEREQRPKAGGDTPVTVGIAVSNWTYMSRHAMKGRVRRITFKTWDFAGQVSVCVCVHAYMHAHVCHPCYPHTYRRITMPLINISCLSDHSTWLYGTPAMAVKELKSSNHGYSIYRYNIMYCLALCVSTYKLGLGGILVF